MHQSVRKSSARAKRTLSTARRVVSADTALTPQQRRFVDEFAAGGFQNQTKAYEAAYKAKGAAAVSGASRLLAQANVAAAVQALRDKLSEKLEVKAERVLAEWVAMGFYDPADLVVTDPTTGEVRDITSPRDLKLLPEQVRRCIVGWSWDRNGNFTLKLAPKTPNLELIGRHLGMFVERKELRLGELDKKSDAELDQAIVQAAAEIAAAEGVPVESILAQLRAAGGGNTMH